MTDALISALSPLTGPDVAVVVRRISGPVDPLWPTEQLAMARAVPSRIAEFTAGRSAARAAMRALGLPDMAIPSGPDRAPIWPNGVVGSISHSGDICVALVARSVQIKGLGVDLELSDPMPADLWSEVCTVAELAALNLVPDTVRGQTAKLLFSAKECTYKCIYSQIQMVIDFSAIEIRHDPMQMTFKATLLHPLANIPAETVWHGRYVVTEGMIATVMVLR